MTLLLDVTLCAFVLGIALATVLGRGVFRAVVFFIVYGLLLSVVWVRLDAVNVALAEAAIGGGLTGVLLLTTYGKLARTGAEADVGRGGPNLPVALICAGLTGALVWAWFALPLPQRPGPELAEALPRAGVGNPVTAVLLNFRAWDTLLESVVLLTALIGLWILCRDEDWHARLGVPQHSRPGGVMAGFGRVLPPVGFLVGVYLVYVGADDPGGAFQGGTVLAAVGLVAALAGLIRPPRIADWQWRAALVFGPVVFLIAGLAGAVLFGGFLTLPAEIAAGAIFAIEAALSVSIAVTLAFLVIGPPQAGHSA
ncbi:MAG: hydrogenase subunit MbhD domain-containing protein [Roseovarius sp.]|nr:hydrogenase subunit MbhD domain-containing protein [Roseovarius sp.]